MSASTAEDCVVDVGNEPYCKLRVFEDLGSPDVLLQLDCGTKLPVHSNVLGMYSKILRGVLETTKTVKQEEPFNLPMVGDSAVQWRQSLLVLYHVVGGQSKEAMWESVNQVHNYDCLTKAVSPGKVKLPAKVWKPAPTPFEDALSIEAIAKKYDMPTLAIMALEKLQKELCHPGAPAMDPLQVAERAMHWRNTEVRETCMEEVARPLQTGHEMSLPATINPLCEQSQGVLHVLVKAVNKALHQTAEPLSRQQRTPQAADLLKLVHAIHERLYVEDLDLESQDFDG